MGLSGETPLLVRVNGVNKMVYVSNLYSLLSFKPVDVEVLSFDYENLSLTFRKVRGISEVEADESYAIEFRGGGSLRVSGSQLVYIIDVHGGLRPVQASRIRDDHALVSMIRGIFRVKVDRFNYLRGKVDRGVLKNVICGWHEWSDIDVSMLDLYNPLKVLLGYEEFEEVYEAGRSERRRATRCYKDPLKAYEASWVNRMQGLPTSILRRGEKTCVKIVYGDTLSRDYIEKIPLEPFLKLKGVLRKSRQVAAVLHVLNHARMKALSKRVATLAVIHLLCGGLPRGLEGIPGLVLRNIAMLVFSDLVAIRVATVKRINGDIKVYDVDVEGNGVFFAGPHPVLLGSHK